MTKKEEAKKIGYINFGYFSPELSSNEAYPDYIREDVTAAVKKIQSHQNRSSVTFGFMTDIHYSKTYIHDIRTTRLMTAWREIKKRVHVDALILGGDYVNDGVKEYKMNNYRELRAHLGNEPYLPANGNHDDNAIWDTYAEEAERGTHQVTAEDLYTVFYNHLPHIPGVEFNEEKGLYYIYNDFAKKVRYIFLDLNELPYEMDENRINIYSREHSYSISQEQLDWLTQKALRFEEEGWDIVVISHTFFRGNESDEGYIKFLYQLLDTYKRGEDLTGMIEQAHGTLKIDAKFSQYKRGTILGCFAGHYHDDYMLRTDEGIPVIFTDCAIMYDYKTPRKDGDKSELLFDMVTIDRQNRTIYLTRIGAGEDRTVIEYS